MPVSFGLVDRAHLGPSWMCPRLRCGYIYPLRSGANTEVVEAACPEPVVKSWKSIEISEVFCMIILFLKFDDLRGCWLISFKWCFFHVLDLFFMFLIKPLQARKKTCTDSIIKLDLSAILTCLCFQPASMIGWKLQQHHFVCNWSVLFCHA